MGALTGHVLRIFLVPSEARGVGYQLGRPLLVDLLFLYPLVDGPADLFDVFQMPKYGVVRTRDRGGGELCVFRSDAITAAGQAATTMARRT